MKRIAVIIASLALTILAGAQPKAAGLVLNGLGLEGVGVSYQHNINDNLFLDAVGLFSYDVGKQPGGRGDVLVDYVVSRPSWSKVKAAFYVGAGLTAGYVGNGYFNEPSNLTPEELYDYVAPDYGGAMVGALLNIGLEISFRFGFQLSFDLKPVLGVHFNDTIYNDLENQTFRKAGFYQDGLLGILPGIGLRYAF